MALGYGTHGGQAAARAFKLAFAVQALEDAKQRLRTRWVKTNPVVLHAQCNAAIGAWFASHGNAGGFAAAGEFDGVG